MFVPSARRWVDSLGGVANVPSIPANSIWPSGLSFLRYGMHAADVLARVAAELALFSGVGFLLFGLNDLAVDIIFF
jgi:hypothetical protein